VTEPVRRTYSIREAAAVLGVSHTFAYELAHRGELPVLRLGRRMVVPVEALHRLIAEGTERVDTSVVDLHQSEKATTRGRSRAPRAV
jgi:excisionase family DNA binding protein